MPSNIMEQNNGVEICVEFTHVATGRESKPFQVSEKELFADVVEKAYEKLGETKKDGDHVYTKAGDNLDDQLNKDLRGIIDKCHDGLFEIRSETGGATPP